MTISTIVSAMQDLNRDVAGIVSAPGTYPTSINTSDAPVCITWMGETLRQGWQGSASKGHFVWRNYRVQVFIMPVGQGEGIDEGISSLYTVAQALGDAYSDSANITLVNDGTYQASIMASEGLEITDTGHTILEYPPGSGHRWHGTEFSVPVKEQWA